MNKNINLCKILKGHEEEIFYNPLLGDIELARIEDKYIVFIHNDGLDELFVKHNGNSIHTDELAIFPSKDQRDWNKWNKENNKKTPKTWSEFVKSERLLEYKIAVVNNQGQHVFVNTASIEKSALALLKIHQLIEVGYGGHVTNKEWRNDDPKYTISYYGDSEELLPSTICHDQRLIAFHTRRQAEKFLKYPENVQLLKDYFMI